MNEPQVILCKSNTSGIAIPPDDENIALAKLYLSTCEMLAGHSYEAILKQQQWNMVAQRLTIENAKTLYTL